MRKKLIISLAAIITIVLIVVLSVIISSRENKMPAVLYYLDNSCTTLISRPENIAFNDPAQIPANIINKLKSKNVISKKCNVNTVTFDTAENVTIDFSKEFLSPDSHVNVLKVYAVVKSVCSTSSVLGITNVKVTVDGRPVKTDKGTGLGYLSDSSINIMNSQEIMTYECKLFFQNKNGELEPETREIDAANGTIEYNVINALMDGPETKGLYDVFLSGTKLTSAETLEGTCYVNFGQLPKASDYNTIRSSLIYTLSSLEGIDQVQILINGKIPD